MVVCACVQNEPVLKKKTYPATKVEDISHDVCFDYQSTYIHTYTQIDCSELLFGLILFRVTAHHDQTKMNLYRISRPEVGLLSHTFKCYNSVASCHTRATVKMNVYVDKSITLLHVYVISISCVNMNAHPRQITVSYLAV